MLAGILVESRRRRQVTSTLEESFCPMVRNRFNILPRQNPARHSVRIALLRACHYFAGWLSMPPRGRFLGSGPDRLRPKGKASPGSKRMTRFVVSEASWPMRRKGL